MQLTRRKLFSFLKEHFPELSCVQGESFLEERIERVEPLERAQGREILSFFSSSLHKSSLEKSRAGCLVTSPLLWSLVKQKEAFETVFVCEHPALAFALVLEAFFEEKEQTPPWGIHPTAQVHPEAEVSSEAVIGAFCVVEKGAVIEKGVRLFPFVYVGEHSVVGAHSVLFPHVVLYPRTVLGKGVRIHSGVVLGADGFGYVQKCENGTLLHVKIPHLGRVVVEDEVEIGANSCVDRGTLSETRIGKGTKIDNLVQIGHNVEIGERSILCGCVGVAGSARIGKEVFLGARAGVGGHKRIGDQSKVGACSVVSKDLPPRSEVFGFPAEDVREYFRKQATLRKWLKRKTLS